MGDGALGLCYGALEIVGLLQYCVVQAFAKRKRYQNDVGDSRKV